PSVGIREEGVLGSGDRAGDRRYAGNRVFAAGDRHLYHVRRPPSALGPRGGAQSRHFSVDLFHGLGGAGGSHSEQPARVRDSGGEFDFFQPHYHYFLFRVLVSTGDAGTACIAAQPGDGASNRSFDRHVLSTDDPSSVTETPWDEVSAGGGIGQRPGCAAIRPVDGA